MGDAMRSPTAGRELVRLGRRGGRSPMLPASVRGRLGESLSTRRTGYAGRSRAGAAQACQIAQPRARSWHQPSSTTAQTRTAGAATNCQPSTIRFRS